MKTQITISKEQLELLSRGTIIETEENNRYYYLPFWYQISKTNLVDSEDEEHIIMHELSPEKPLPRDLIEQIQFTRGSSEDVVVVQMARILGRGPFESQNMYYFPVSATSQLRFLRLPSTSKDDTRDEVRIDHVWTNYESGESGEIRIYRGAASVLINTEGLLEAILKNYKNFGEVL